MNASFVILVVVGGVHLIHFETSNMDLWAQPIPLHSPAANTSVERNPFDSEEPAMTIDDPRPIAPWRIRPIHHFASGTSAAVMTSACDATVVTAGGVASLTQG